MSDAEFNIPKGAQIALKTFLKMIGFQPEPIIAQIDQIGQTVNAYKLQQDDLLQKVDYIFNRLKQEENNGIDLALDEREHQRGNIPRSDEQS